MDIHGYGSEWDPKRSQSRYWIASESGEEYEGFGPDVESARLAALDALAGAGFTLADLGGLATEIRDAITAEEVALRRCPGGQALDPQLDYTRAFVAGSAIAVEFLEGPMSGVIEVEHAGMLHLPSGRVAAYDPLASAGDTEAFDLDIPPGEYPVLISLAQIAGEPRRRTIAAAIQFNAGPVVSWKQVLRMGENPLELAPREMFGYNVDTGTGCFSDAGFDPSELEKLPLEEYSQPHPQLIAFSTGWGDGRYATFLGVDAFGAPAMLVTDFELLAPHSL